VQEILKQLLVDFPCEDENVYFFPKMSDKKVAKKLANAKKSYANFSDDEEVYILCDNTVFGNAKDGFVLTSKALYSNDIAKGGINPLEIYSYGKVKLMGTDVFNEEKEKIGTLDFTAIEKEAAETILHILSVYSITLRLVAPLSNRGISDESLVIKAIEKLKESDTQDFTLGLDDFPEVKSLTPPMDETQNPDQTYGINMPNTSPRMSQYESPSTNDQIEVSYIGLFKRFLAFLMDASIVFVLGGILFGVLAYFLSFEDDSMLWPVMQVVSLLYFTLMESSSRQATLGKAKMRIKVVNSKTEKLSFLNALGRYLGKYLSFILLGVGFFMIPFTKKKQALHDVLAKTYTVKIENYEEYIQEQNQTISTKVFALLGFGLLGFLLLMVLVSMLTSQVAKDIGNFFALVLGGIIWTGIFYAIYRMNNSSAGQGVTSAFSQIGGAFRESEADKQRREEQELKSRANRAKATEQDAPEKDPDDDSEQKVGELRLSINDLSNLTHRNRLIRKKDGKYFIDTGLGNRDLYADDLDSIQIKARQYFLKWDGVNDVEIEIY